jgi:hypothetical protein
MLPDLDPAELSRYVRSEFGDDIKLLLVLESIGDLANGPPVRGADAQVVEPVEPTQLLAIMAELIGVQTREAPRVAVRILASIEHEAGEVASSRMLVNVLAISRCGLRIESPYALQLLDEPVATAWAYLTFDVAVLDCEREPFQVLTHDGDLYLGGDDVDCALACWAADELLRLHGWDVRSDPEVFDRLVLECERAKTRLSYAAETVIKLAEVDPASPVAAGDMPLERARLQALCGPLLQRTFIVCDEVLHRVNLRAQDVGAVFLAGGSSQLPMICEGLEAYFGKPPRREFDPMEVLAIGASLAA